MKYPVLLLFASILVGCGTLEPKTVITWSDGVMTEEVHTWDFFSPCMTYWRTDYGPVYASAGGSVIGSVAGPAATVIASQNIKKGLEESGDTVKVDQSQGQGQAQIQADVEVGQ